MQFLLHRSKNSLGGLSIFLCISTQHYALPIPCCIICWVSKHCKMNVWVLRCGTRCGWGLPDKPLPENDGKHTIHHWFTNRPMHFRLHFHTALRVTHIVLHHMLGAKALPDGCWVVMAWDSLWLVVPEGPLLEYGRRPRHFSFSRTLKVQYTFFCIAP